MLDYEFIQRLLWKGEILESLDPWSRTKMKLRIKMIV